jgi:hypothetical protein
MFWFFVKRSFITFIANGNSVHYFFFFKREYLAVTLASYIEFLKQAKPGTYLVLQKSWLPGFTLPYFFPKVHNYF